MSHKKIFQVVLELNKFVQQGKDIRVKWFFDSSDEDIEEMGEDLADLIEIPFELVPVESEYDDDDSWDIDFLD